MAESSLPFQCALFESCALPPDHIVRYGERWRPPASRLVQKNEHARLSRIAGVK